MALRNKKFFLLLLPLYFFCFLLALELFLEWRWQATHEVDQPGFHTQYLHPYYFFSFPTSKELLALINGPGDSVDGRGYRAGLGPEAKGDRQLAFLMGGSTAFGSMSSGDKATPTAFLNQIQDRYFFVNAGVPSWNTFQELLRVIKQVLPEKPALIVHLNGFNDIATAYDRVEQDLPADAPESFEQLALWVEDIRSPRVRERLLWHTLSSRPLVRNLFLTRVREKIFGEQKLRHASELPYDKYAGYAHTDAHRKESSDESLRLYLQNMDMIAELCQNRGIKFKVFFQPFMYTHKMFENKKDEEMEWGGSEFLIYYNNFKNGLDKTKHPYLEDISAAFAGKTPEEIQSTFHDTIHFSDAGNRELAEIMWAAINK